MVEIVKTQKHRAADDEFLDMENPETIALIERHFPAVTATRPVGMSDNYQFLDSAALALRLQKEHGLRLAEVSQQHSRKRDPKGQEHVMRFRLPPAEGFTQEAGVVPELVLLNSHNGRCAARAYAGMFRFVCANGLVVRSRDMGSQSFRHFGVKNSGSNVQDIISGVAKSLGKVYGDMATMEGIGLSTYRQKRLAEQLLAIRKTPSWVTPKHILESHRKEDDVDSEGKRSMWVTFNVLQENLTARTVRGTGENGRPCSIRPITGCRADLVTNSSLWDGLLKFGAASYPDMFPEVAA